MTTRRALIAGIGIGLALGTVPVYAAGGGSTTSAAACVLKKTGAVRIAARCKSGERSLSLLTSAVIPPTPVIPAIPAGPTVVVDAGRAFLDHQSYNTSASLALSAGTWSIATHVSVINSSSSDSVLATCAIALPNGAYVDTTTIPLAPNTFGDAPMQNTITLGSAQKVRVICINSLQNNAQAYFNANAQAILDGSATGVGITYG